MARIVTNALLHPTKRIIENWNRDFRTSDGPNTSSFINLDDIAIPYDSHYTSRIVLPANSTDYYLNYGALDTATFLLIKVTYNGNYDYPNEDNFDSLYYYESQNYNINYYFDDNSGKTYPIGKILLLNGSLTNKLEKIYLNNPLDYDVILDVFHANVYENIQPPIPINSAITINNLYYSDIFTDQVECIPIWFTTTTTTTYIDSGITTTTTSQYPITTTTSTTILKTPMIISRNIIDGFYIFSSTGQTIGLFDYFTNDSWVHAGQSGSFIEFSNISNIRVIRFYFAENSNYYGTLKTDDIKPYDYNNGLYFVDVLPNGFVIDIGGIPSDFYDDNEYYNTYSYEQDDISNSSICFTGSTGFIINQYVVSLSGYSLISHYLPYDDIISIDKDTNTNTINIDSISFYYILNFLTDLDFLNSYHRIINIYNSSVIGNCSYLTPDDMYENQSNPPLTTTTTTSIFTISPSISYNNSNSNQVWDGGVQIVPYNVLLNFSHSGVTGWTLSSLKELFIDYVYDKYIPYVDFNEINIQLYVAGSPISITGITKTGLYDVVFSYKDLYNNIVINKIENINVIQNSPIVYYKDYILTSYLSGNTNVYTGSTNDILPNITIESGFTFNLYGFNYLITKNDIIDNLVEYVIDENGDYIDKHIVKITIAKSTVYGTGNTYENVVNPGIYCVETLIEDVFGNKTIGYFIMNVVSDDSVYSEGFWQDNKVWFDYVDWLDHLIVGEL